MKPPELRAIRKRAGLTQAELARVFRMGASAGRTVRHWEAGSYTPPGPILLLYEMLHDGRLVTGQPTAEAGYRSLLRETAGQRLGASKGKGDA